IAPGANVISRACPLFVPLVEEGWLEHKVTRAVAEEYLAELRNAHLESLILGCTHYPLLAPLISELMGPGVRLIDSGAEAARATAQLLAERGQLAQAAGGKGPQHHFFLSDEPRRRSFSSVAETFLGRPLPHVTVVDQTDLPWFERAHGRPAPGGTLS
ncbi:MAG: aspartate/glutamate racemase family protein, partial [Candidatus Eisenbacteria bacterium]